jgi:hypothetical protein
MVSLRVYLFVEDNSWVSIEFNTLLYYLFPCSLCFNYSVIEESPLVALGNFALSSRPINIQTARFCQQSTEKGEIVTNLEANHSF